MRDEDFRSLLEYRMVQAHEALCDAELLLNAGRYRAAANRLYYACFYAASRRFERRGPRDERRETNFSTTEAQRVQSRN